MKKTAIILMLITVLTKILGFTRDITLSYFYGASAISDAYLISLTIPTGIFAFLGLGISTGYIPIYSKIEAESGELQANRYTNNLVNIMLLICTILFVLGLSFTTPIVKLFASGFEGEILLTTVKFTKITLIGIYFWGLVYIFSGFLQLKENYVVPEMIGMSSNIILIISIILSTKTNIIALAIGSVIATASQVFILWPFIYKKGYRYKWLMEFKDKYMIKMAYIVGPLTLGGSIDQINSLVDRTIASNIAIGGISALNYATKLNSFVQAIFVGSIMTVMYPIISRMAAAENIEGFKKMISSAITSINILIVPAAIGAMIFAQPVVELLFARGAFDKSAIEMTSSSLFFYSVGMVGFGLRGILTKAFYSLQDTKTPLINGFITLITNIILNILLSRIMGIGGLALATSIASTVCTVLLFISLRKKIGAFGSKDIIISFFKTMIASLIMGIICRSAFVVLKNFASVNLSLIISILIGVAVYIPLIYFSKINEVEDLIYNIRNKIKV